jgi:hypothetical protein
LKNKEKCRKVAGDLIFGLHMVKLATRLLDNLRWMILQIRDSKECAKKELDF